MNQKDIEIIKILGEKFFFSKEESKEFLILIGENFKENLYKRLDKNKENFIKFLEKLIFWDNNRMIETSEKYFKNLKLDENKVYSKILDLGSAEGYFANFVKNNNFFCNDVFISIDTNIIFLRKG
ncbi:hypothetical protein DLH72_00555 [Candidatus Gracilibacteria bacterium]|nr:MAG: hypothetical protein DLH72_00555 [Candidatus Gracilibacteria bacterium]